MPPTRIGSNRLSIDLEPIVQGVLVVVVLTSTHRYNAVRGHRTGSNNSGAEDYLRRKNKKNQKILHTISETNAYTSDNNKTVGSAYVRINIHIIC